MPFMNSIFNSAEVASVNQSFPKHRAQARRALLPLGLAAIQAGVSWPEAGSPVGASSAAMMLCKAHKNGAQSTRQAQISKISWPDVGSPLGADDVAMLCHEQTLSGSSKTPNNDKNCVLA